MMMTSVGVSANHCHTANHPPPPTHHGTAGHGLIELLQSLQRPPNKHELVVYVKNWYWHLL